MRCPSCALDGFTLLGLSLHLEDSHPKDAARAQIVIGSGLPPKATAPSAWPAYPNAFPGVDIDAVHHRS